MERFHFLHLVFKNRSSLHSRFFPPFNHSHHKEVAMQRKITLEEHEIPTAYYNILADLTRKPDPPLHPATMKPVGPDDLAPIFPMELIKQEVSTERYVPIADEVRDAYTMFRPTPLIRALNLER